MLNDQLKILDAITLYKSIINQTNPQKFVFSLAAVIIYTNYIYSLTFLTEVQSNERTDKPGWLKEEMLYIEKNFKKSIKKMFNIVTYFHVGFSYL